MHKRLFDLAHAAKQCGEYQLANQIFAVLAYTAISGNVGEYGVYIGYEQDPGRDDIIESLSDPDGAGYYDLPFLFSTANDYTCIPLPLVSRHFMNHIVWRCAVWCDRDEDGHIRNHWRLSHDAKRQEAAQRDLWRRFSELVPDEMIALAVRAILAPPEIEEAEPVTAEEVEMADLLGPATLAKLRAPIEAELEEYYAEA